MKKLVKLSLAAAVATAGLTTTASAVSLEEAIKGVDVSGQFRYRLHEINNTVTKANSQTSTQVDIEVGVTVPVNDMVSAVFLIDNENGDTDGAVDSGNVTIEDYYFQYVNGNTTVLFGSQDIPGRISDGAQADGIVALHSFGDVTVAGAAFHSHGVGTGEAYSAIVAGKFGPVSGSAQYITVGDSTTGNNGIDIWNVEAAAKVGPVKLAVEHTERDEDANSSDFSTTKAFLSGSMGIVSAKVGFVSTGDQGSGSLDRDNDAASEYQLWNLDSAGTGSENQDMDIYVVDASVKVTDKVSLRAAYADGEAGNGSFKDVNEWIVQAGYKMSSNLNTYIRYGEYDESTANDNEIERARLEIQYKF